jgi:hypothetical protein
MARGKLRAGLLAVLLGVGAGGCDVFDFTVELSAQTFTLDFGQQSGTVPTVACSDAADVCGSEMAAVNVDTSSMAGVPSDVEVALACDQSSGQCFAQANARAAQTVAVLQSDDLGDKIARNGLSFVQRVDVGYTIPFNTLTFEIPQIDVYAGPAGSVRETDPGVAAVGSTQPIPAGVAITDEQQISITDDTPARPVIEHAIEHKQDFVFIVVAAPRMNAGSPVPAGAVQIDVFPSVVVGLPR